MSERDRSNQRKQGDTFDRLERTNAKFAKQLALYVNDLIDLNNSYTVPADKADLMAVRDVLVATLATATTSLQNIGS